MKDSDNTRPSKGWILAFHPDLICGTALGANIRDYTFFSYRPEEALHVSLREKQVILELLDKINEELQRCIDCYSQKIISKYIERKEYEQAQTLIDQLPDAIWTDKKQLQANLFIASERYSDAAKLAEEKLLSQASELHCTLITLLEIALKEQRNEDAEYIANVSKSTATALDQWEYAAYVAHFQLHCAKKERIKTLKTFLQMIRSLSKIWDLNASPLYRHIKTKSGDTAFGSTIKKTLLNSLKEEPEYDFLNISENISEDTLSELLAAEEEKELHH